MSQQDTDSKKKLHEKLVSRRALFRGAAGTGAGLMLGSGLQLPVFAQEAAQQSREDPAGLPDGISTPSPTITYAGLGATPQGERAPNPFAKGRLLVNGQNFVANSVVRWNGNNRPTTFHSSTELTVQLLASDMGSIGTAVITVFNPATGGRGSNSLKIDGANQS